MLFSRIDVFLIWSHGLPFLGEICEEIENSKDLSVLRIERKKFPRFGKFVRDVYNCDYAPLFHLRSKIQYLKRVGDEVAIIVVSNNAPNIRYFGVGAFRHQECLNIKNVKLVIRNRFNPKNPDGTRSEEHVVHGTDNPEQASHLLGLFQLHEFRNNLFNLPRSHCVGTPGLGNSIYEIAMLDMKLLSCTNLFKKKGKILSIEIPLENSSQFLGLSNIKIYNDYLEEFRGLGLNKFYSSERFLALKDAFLSCGDIKIFPPIDVVKKDDGSFLIIDGLHRCSIFLFFSVKFVHVRICNGKN